MLVIARRLMLADPVFWPVHVFRPAPVRSVLAYTASLVPGWAIGGDDAEAAAVGSEAAPMQARRGEIVGPPATPSPPLPRAAL